MAKQQLYGSDAVETAEDNATASVTATTVGTKRGIDVTGLGADGITDVNGVPVLWDSVAYAEPTTSSETYTYSFSGVDQVIYFTFYTDSGKGILAATAITKTAP